MAFYIFPRAIPKKECKSLLKYCLKNSKFMDASTIKKGFSEIHIDGTEKDSDKETIYNYEMRKTDISWITDKENRVNELVWGFIREANKLYFNYKLDYFQAIQFARYKNGGHYDWHQDAGEIVKGQMEQRKLSLTLSLTDDKTYDGGLLQFYCGGRPYDDKDHDIERDIKSVGTVIVFDSRDWHRVTPVTKGTRYSLVCWTVGPNFT